MGFRGYILRNKVYSGKYGCQGIWINSSQGNSTDPILVANNFVQVGKNNTEYGLRVDNCDYLDVVHNSVLITGGGSSTKAYFHDYSNASINIYNNIFQNQATGYAFYAGGSYGVNNSDHNNLYTNGNNLGYWSGDQSDLSTWVGTTNLDSNSLSVMVQFADTTDLHTGTANLNKAGTPVTAVPLDIDQQPRDPLSPDIGADEFNIPSDDVAIQALQAPVEPFVAGNQGVKLQLFNNGADTLYNVTIQWEVNGVAQTPYSWSGALPSGEVRDSVNVGTYNFQFSATYKVKAWTEQPNGTSDAQPANDTIMVADLYPALSGIYTIGGSNPDFADFGNALQALQQRGVGGWVTFNVRNGDYNEQISIDEYLGVSPGYGGFSIRSQ
ncbi:MAG: hypothetical protein U5L96_21425 [Owenweeksia sp.]|nr:hypothetical protein [Owenweeksia sp.]